MQSKSRLQRQKFGTGEYPRRPQETPLMDRIDGNRDLPEWVRPVEILDIEADDWLREYGE